MRPLPISNGKFVLNSNEARVGSADMVPTYQNSNKSKSNPNPNQDDKLE